MKTPKKWLVAINIDSLGSYNEIFEASSIEKAETKAFKALDYFIRENGRDYDEVCLPEVNLFEIVETTTLDVEEYILSLNEKKRKHQEKLMEDRERSYYENLKKKFEKEV